MVTPVVFLPGMMCDLRLYAMQLLEFGRDRGVTVAPITMGERIEEIASNILDRVPAKFALVGSSMGGVVAMEMLRRAPDRVERIAVFASGCLPEPAAIAAERETRMARVKAGRLDHVLDEDFPDDCAAPGELQPKVTGFLRQMAKELGPQVYLRQARAMMRRPDQQRTLRSARVPALVVAGRHDTLVLPRRQGFVADLMPRGRLVETEAGHVPPVETPDAVTTALQGWLERENEPLVLR